MKLPRPYIPMSVRAQVIARQARALLVSPDAIDLMLKNLRPGTVVKSLTKRLFGNQAIHLDHDPPLAARKRIRNHYTGEIRFEPDANDPRYLVWRTKEDHRVKTFVRGEHGQYSDITLIKRERRRHRKRKPKKKIQNRENYRWPSRPFRKVTK